MGLRIILVCVCLVSVGAVRAQIPVTDVANLAQTNIIAVKDFVAQARRLAELVKVYKAQYDTYRTVYDTYSMHVRNLRGARDKDSLLRLIAVTIEQLAGNKLVMDALGLDPDDVNFFEQLALVLSEIYGVKQDFSMLKSLYEAGYESYTWGLLEARWKRYRARSEAINSGYRMAALHRENAKDRGVIINALESRVRGLGDESQLETLQVMAAQNQAVMAQGESLSAQMSFMISQQNEAERRRTWDRQVFEERRMERRYKQFMRPRTRFGKSMWD